VRAQAHLWAILAGAEQEMVAGQVGLELGHVTRKQPSDELSDPGAMDTLRDEVCAVSNHRQRMGHRHGAFTPAQNNMVVLRVAHPREGVG
jgi:hypothetical protein